MALYLIFGFVLIALIVLVVWFLLQRKKEKAAAAASTDVAADPGGAGNEEIDALVREAERRLAASKQGDRLVSLPIFFLVGDTGSTKTSVMVNAGLEPELLAGLVYRDNNLVPTRTANLWFSRRTIFVEAGGPVPADPAKWARLVRKLQPRAGVASQSMQAPRAVLVCYDAETFTRPGAQESATAAARNLHARLAKCPRPSASICRSMCCSPKWTGCRSSPSTSAISPKRKPGKCWAPPSPCATCAPAACMAKSRRRA
jgi:type VI secretion system protein ImpL